MTPSKPVTPYVWTPSKIMIGLCIVCLGAGVPIWAMYRQLQPMRGDRSADAIENKASFLSVVERDPFQAFDLSNLILDKDKILSGGPAKDGIPSLRTEAAHVPAGATPSAHKGAYSAKIVQADKADFLHGRARVVGLVVNGKARAYPINVLNWHEAINDNLGQVPLCVIYCPLCDSVSVVDRRLGNKTLEFGISGLLSNSNVLLYDRMDQALWSQVKMTAISGPHAGQSLKHLDQWEITSKTAWIKKHPDTTFVSYETGYRRQYRQSPYQSYFRTDALMFPVDGLDHRLPNKTAVIGIQYGKITRAYTFRAILQAPQGILKDRLDGQALQLEASEKPLTVRVVKIPAGAKVIHTFWFAWQAYHPNTELVRDIVKSGG